MDTSKRGKFRKLKPKTDGPFKVLKRIGKNAYEIELPKVYGVSPTFNIADLSPYHGDGSNEDLRTSLFQPGENDTGVCSLISNYMHLAQVFQVEKDVKITCSPSHHVTCSPSNNKNPKSAEIKELKNGVSWAPSHDISYGTSQDITWEASYNKDISVNLLLTLIR